MFLPGTYEVRSDEDGLRFTFRPDRNVLKPGPLMRISAAAQHALVALALALAASDVRLRLMNELRL